MKKFFLLIAFSFNLAAFSLWAQNPFINPVYSADPVCCHQSNNY